jgi:hypothetical protein
MIRFKQKNIDSVSPNKTITYYWQRPTAGPDPDATAFLTAAGITDPTISNAIDYLVQQLKIINIWSKIYVLYPFVGGTATTHKFNLKDPRDLDIAFRAVFNGGVTHNSAGVTGNAINGWYDTKFGTSILDLTVGAGTFIFVGNETNTGSDIGNFGGAPNNAINLVIRSGGFFGGRCNSILVSNIANLTSKGFFGVNREPNDSTGFYNILNNSEVFTSVSFTSTSAVMYGLRLGPFEGFYTDRNHQTTVIATGLDATERANLRTVLTTFNVTILGR